MMWYGWGPGGWGAWLLMTVIMLVFWGGLAALAVWVIRSFARPPARDGSVTARLSGPVTILEDRFARGEIDRDEYEQRRTSFAGTAARGVDQKVPRS